MRIAVTFTVLLVTGVIAGCANKSVTPIPAPSVDQKIAAPSIQFYPHSISDTEVALDSALNSAGLVVIAREDAPAGRFVEAKRSDNTSIYVNLVKLKDGTEARVRVGLMGDDAYARMLLATIAASF